MVVQAQTTAKPPPRLNHLLKWLGLSRSVWYARRKDEPKKPGRRAKPVPGDIALAVRQLAQQYPWWGYKRLAIVLRRAGHMVSKKFVHAVFKAEGLMQKRRATKAELYQSAKLFELLPTRPNALWQADVTYIHIPGHGWWYAVTVIDYFSRYLLACHLTASYSAPEVSAAIELAIKEAERLHGPMEKTPFLVTDNGSCFLARRFQSAIKEKFQHVRTRYRTPQQLGLLERFHQTLKREEVYWQLYDNPQDAREKLDAFRQRYNDVRPHWALEPAGGGDVLTPKDVYVDGGQITLPRWQGWAKAAKDKLDESMQQDAELRQAA